MKKIFKALHYLDSIYAVPTERMVGTRYIVSVVIFAILALMVMPTAAQEEKKRLQDADSEAAWREDIEYLQQRLPNAHPDPYHTISEADFDAAYDSLLAELPYLSDEQIVVRIMRIVSLLNDGHSSVPPYWQQNYPFHFYPLRFYLFDDGLFVIDTLPPYEEAIGAKVIQVGTMDFETAYNTLALSAFYENEWSLRGSTTMQFGLVEVLLGAGIIESVEQPNYVLEKPDGEHLTLNPDAVPVTEYVGHFGENLWRLPSIGDPLYLSNPEAFWLTYLEDEQVVYMQYNFVMQTADNNETISQIAVGIESLLDSETVRRVIVDMRHNPGGDIGTTRPLMKLFNEHEFFQDPNKLIFLISRNTFSAAVWLSIQYQGKAVFIGEPTGGNVHMYENPRPLRLSNSGLLLMIASRERDDVEDDDPRDTIEPDVFVPLASADFFSHQDPVLAAALAY